MPNIYHAASQFRAELLRRERAAATAMVRAYGDAWQRIRVQLDLLGEQMQAAKLRGEEIGPGWLLQQDRLQRLQQQVEAEIRAFAQLADATITEQQAAAVKAAQEHAEQLILAGLGESPPGITITLAKLPIGALTDLVGFLQDGSPLSDLLDELGPEASAATRKALITGLATGQGVRGIARLMREALGGNLIRALTIARTEILRSYRESSRRTYQANSDVVEGWVWHSALNARTCAFCWSMHGTVHKLDEPMATHPNCRCTMVPLTKTWAQLGFPDVPETRVRIPPGPDLFARLSPAKQREILGPAKFAAFQQGKLDLIDLRGFRTDPNWGRVGFERSLKDVLGEDWRAAS